jgi:hypothetical protein
MVKASLMNAVCRTSVSSPARERRGPARTAGGKERVYERLGIAFGRS